MNRPWFVRSNDLIGGTCIMPVDQPPSAGFFEVADFISTKAAHHIVALHNAWLGAMNQADEYEEREPQDSGLEPE